MSAVDLPRRVVVFGSSRTRPGDESWDAARELGRRVAEARWELVTGGYGGIMEAASEGAVSAGGEALGVLCEAFGSSGNRHLTRHVVTKDLFGRLERLIELGDAYVVMEGSTGTLVELATVWELMNKRLAPIRPLVVLGGFWDPVLGMLGGLSTWDPRIPERGGPERMGGFITRAQTAEQAIEQLGRAWTP